MRNLAILFWFYKEPAICKNRLEIMKRHNPDSKIFGLYGGDTNDLDQYESLKPLLDNLYTSPFTDSDWKWRHGDLMLLDWYEKRGVSLAWDSVVITQWDMLIFDSFEHQLPDIKRGEIFLSGLRPLDKELESAWSWTREGSTHRKDYLAFLAYVKKEYGYSKLFPPCCLFILEVFPRLFFEKYAQVHKKELGFLEYKIPVYTEIFGVPAYERDLSVCWTGDDRNFALNARGKALDKNYIEKQLADPDGWRIFHPYFEAWTLLLRRRESNPA